MDFIVDNVELASQWHPTKNSPLTPESVTLGSNRNVWWVCSANHPEYVWSAKPNGRFRAKSKKCPVCWNLVIMVGFNDLATTHPVVVAEWHPVRNGEVTPERFTYGSKQKIWWIGVDCGHEWVATILSRTVSSQGCAVCRGLQIQVGVNDLASNHPEIAAEWHPTKNGELTPEQFTSGSNKNVWWLGECGHEWRISPNHRVRGNGCYECLGRKPGERQSLLSETKYFAELHPTKNITVDVSSLRLMSNVYVWWLGADCGHEWFMKVASRGSQDQGCAVCHGSQIQVGFNDLGTTHPDLVSEWHPTKNGDKTPYTISRGHRTKVWWKCKKGGHEWFTQVAGRGVSNSGCPECDAKTYVSKAEQEIADFVVKLGVDIRTSVRSVIKGELDIYAPERNIAIEFNGLYWHSEPMGKDKTFHSNKWKACKEKGIQLIQIWEDDWNNNPELVKRMLAHKLGVSEDRKVYARKTRIVELGKTIVEPFLVVNHLQGYRIAKYFGLVEKTDKNDSSPVSVIGVAKKGDTGLEIIRFATNAQVVGGFTKLLAHVLKQPEYAHVTKVYSYSHNDHSDGGMYENNGFNLEHSGTPGYSYWKNRWPKRMNRLGYSPSRIKLNPNLEYEEGLTERELAALNGLVRIWDSGSSLWVKQVGS